ncbi:MAG: protein translocase subunit SecD [Dehalococcoidales bacterium]|jgi:preprotein translocase subunit SecD|nr:protein translocase subunit SecD [Dehalococcoidales bacterium]
MLRKNTLILIAIFLTFVLALLVVLPVDEGLLGKKGALLGLDLQGGIHLVYKADLSEIASGDTAEIMDGAVAVIANRINPLGVTEPIISKQGEDHIVVELPGLSVTEKQKERLGRTALLEFGEQATEEEEARWENELGRWKPATGTINGQEQALNSSYFKENTYVDRDDFGRVLLVFEWDEEGSTLSEEITSRMIGKRLGIFEGDAPLLGEDGLPTAPTVQGVITDSGQITGLSFNEAAELSKQLNLGRLPVSLEIIYELTISPVLGADFVNLSLKAGAIGIALVMLFMSLYYRLPGLVASLSLIFYGVLVMALFKMIPVTLTLAGIGGFVLSIGMAVDANVLIFERIKEELGTGRTLGAAIEVGFSRAWKAIRDSNITTFIVCGILYWVGSSIVAGAPVMGFALTLFIGVAVSMFTAILATRTLLRLFVGTRLAQRTNLFSPYLRRK